MTAKNTDGSTPIDPTATGPAATPNPATTATEPAPSDSPEQIRADIERTRAELGDSVEALAAKADVKARARERANAARNRAKEMATVGVHSVQQRAGGLPRHARNVGVAMRRRPAPVAGGLAGFAGVAAALLIGRRRAAAKARASSRRMWRTR